MPYPMINNETIELSTNLIKKLSPSHLNFFLQHKKQMRIDRDDNKNILYVINDFNLFKNIYEKVYGIKNPEGNDVGGFILTEKDIDNYLNIINFN